MFRTIITTLFRATFVFGIFCSWPLGSSIGQTLGAAVSVTPDVVAAGTSPTMTLFANGTIDLSIVTPAQLGLRPDSGISNFKIIQQFAQTLIFSVDIASSATPGVRTLFVNDQAATR